MSLIKCPECGKEISNKANTCIHCGYPIHKHLPQVKVCGLCGFQNEDTTEYCKQCGMKMQRYSGNVTAAPQVHNSTEKPKQTWKTVIIVFCCIMYPFVGTILMWILEKPRSRDRRIGLTILCLTYWLLLLFYRIINLA